MFLWLLILDLYKYKFNILYCTLNINTQLQILYCTYFYLFLKDNFSSNEENLEINFFSDILTQETAICSANIYWTPIMCQILC